MDENDIRLRTGCTGGGAGGASAARPFVALSCTPDEAVLVVGISSFKLALVATLVAVRAGAECHAVCLGSTSGGLLLSIAMERGGPIGG
jgi:hypothetical protein